MLCLLRHDKIVKSPRSAVSNFLFLTITMRVCVPIHYPSEENSISDEQYDGSLCCVCVCVQRQDIFWLLYECLESMPAKLFTRTRTRSFCLVAMMVNGENGRLCVAVYGSLWLRLSCLLHYQVIGKIIL